MGGTRPRLRAIAGPAAAALVVAATATIMAFGLERIALHASRNGRRLAEGPTDPWRKHGSKGLIRPVPVAAGGSGMKPDEVVLGVEAGGKARAYRLDALRDRDRHVVNDVIGGVPVTVTYCDLTDCARAYADPGAKGGRPLGIELVGIHEGEMVIKIGGVLYLQRTNAPMATADGPAPGPPPYATVIPVRTTWGEWLLRHPGTDVYAGPG